MPAVVAAVVSYIVPATAATAVTIAGTAISYATLIGYAVTIGASIAYSSAQNAKLRNQLNNLGGDSGRNVMARDPLAYQRMVYGEVPLTGPIPFMHTTGTKNEFLHVLIEIAGHEVNALNTIYFDGSDGWEAVTLDGAGAATGKYAGFFTCKKHLGTPEQAADADLIAAAPTKWTANHKLSGHAYLYCMYKYSTDLYPNGMPTTRVLTQGRKVLDPAVGIVLKIGDVVAGNRHIGCATAGLSVGMRVVGLGLVEDTRIVSIDGSGTFFTVNADPLLTSSAMKLACGLDTWTANAALCVADYMTDIKFGKKIPWARMNTADLPAEVNICDEDIVLEDLTTEKRYALNGTTTSDNDALNDMLTAMAGRVTDAGGTWSIFAGAYRTVTAPTFTDDDLVGAFTLQPRVSMHDSYSGVRGTYFSPQNDWQPADFPVVKNDEYTRQDGGRRRWKDVAYPFSISPATAQRLAKIDLERGRQQQVFQAIYKLKAFQLRCCDTVKITRAVLGWTNKEFEILDWALRVITSDKGNITLAVALTCKETAAAVWDWADGEETAVDLAPNTDLPNPQIVPNVSGFTVLADDTTGVLQDDGTWIPRVRISWTTPNDTYLEQGGQAYFEYKKHADVNWTSWNPVPASQTFEFITDVLTETAYDFRMRFINQVGARGTFKDSLTDYPAGYTVPKRGANPSAPASLTATGLPEAIKLEWPQSGSTNVAGYDIYELGSSSPAPIDSTTPTFQTGRDTTYTRHNVTAGTTLFYWVRTRATTSPRRSAWTGPSSATAANGAVVALANASTAISTANGKNKSFYQSGTPTATATGDLWFKTGTDELYQWNGSSWVLLNFTAPMISGQITTTQITDLAISTPKLASNSITAAKVGTNEIITVAANIHDAVITSAKIVTLDAGQISAGNITVALVLTTGTLKAGTGTDNEVMIDSNGLRVGLTSGGSVRLSQYTRRAAGVQLYNGSGTLKSFFEHHGGITTLTGANSGSCIIYNFNTIASQGLIIAGGTTDSESVDSPLYTYGSAYVAKTAYFQDKTIHRGNIEIQSTNRLVFKRDSSGGTYIDENFGMNLRAYSDHPVQVRGGALCLDGTSGGGTTYTSGRIYFTDSIYLHVSSGNLYLNDGNGDRALT